MYNKSKLCIRVDNQHTPLFKSSVGVRQGDVLSPKIFNLFINDLPDILSSCENHVNVNERRIDCLMYADDIVLFSDTSEGLQQRLDKLSLFCSKWCLTVNLKKTQVMIFNKSGRHLNYNFHLDGKSVSCTYNFKYLGITFIPSGKFSQCKEELFKKSMKACFKLQQCMSSSNPSVSTLLHLYDHTVKPILTYGCEIWGMFSTTSAACTKHDQFILEKVFENDASEKSHIKFLKYILGVNKRSSNFAVVSELGRYPMYFSIVLAMLKYYYRLEKVDNGLLYDTYLCNKNLHQDHNVNSWYSSIEFILKKLGISVGNRSYSLYQFIKLIKAKLHSQYSKFWNAYRDQILKSEQGKLFSYFSFKTIFGFEKYLNLKEFRHRQSICKIRISSHSLRIETDRYLKNYIDRTERKCQYCKLDKTEDEKHFITECSLYVHLRDNFFKEINLKCQNFQNLDKVSKFNWLFISEDLDVLKHLGQFIFLGFDLRRTSNIIN